MSACGQVLCYYLSLVLNCTIGGCSVCKWSKGWPPYMDPCPLSNTGLRWEGRTAALRVGPNSTIFKAFYHPSC